MSYSSKTKPSTTKSMGKGMNYTAAGGPANSSGGPMNGSMTIVNGAAGGPMTYPNCYAGKFINEAGGRK